MTPFISLGQSLHFASASSVRSVRPGIARGKCAQHKKQERNNTTNFFLKKNEGCGLEHENTKGCKFVGESGGCWSFIVSGKSSMDDRKRLLQM